MVSGGATAVTGASETRRSWTGPTHLGIGPDGSEQGGSSDFGSLPVGLRSSDSGGSMAEETRVIYHLEDQDTPYLIRIGVPPQRVTLADFKLAINKPNFRFFFKSVDDDFG